MGLLPTVFSLLLSFLPGINAQARRLQKSRSRAASGGTVVPKERADNLSLRRSISDMNLSAKKRRERKNIMSMAGGEAVPPGDDGDGDEGESEATRSKELESTDSSINPTGTEEPIDGASLEQLSQCLIQPPTQNPYFLLLQSYNEKQVGGGSSGAKGRHEAGNSPVHTAGPCPRNLL